MKKAIKITLICLSVVITSFFLYIGLLVFAVCGEHLLVKWDIDNPYVDRRFSGWEEVNIDNIGTFSIPENWTVTKDDTVYTILDETGEVWAYGGIFGSDADYSNSPDFLSQIYATKPTVKAKDLLSFPMMKGSDMDKYVFDFDGTEKIFYRLQFSKDIYKDMVWFCPLDLLEQPKQYAIAEAMIYSYAFAYAMR